MITKWDTAVTAVYVPATALIILVIINTCTNTMRFNKPIQNNTFIDDCAVIHRVLSTPTCLLSTYLEIRLSNGNGKFIERRHDHNDPLCAFACFSNINAFVALRSYCQDNNNVLLMRDSNRSCIYEYLINMLPASSIVNVDKLWLVGYDTILSFNPNSQRADV